MWCIDKLENKMRAKYDLTILVGFSQDLLWVLAGCADKSFEYLCIYIFTYLSLLQSGFTAAWEKVCFSSNFNLCLKPKRPSCNSIQKWSFSRKWSFNISKWFFHQELKYEIVSFIWRNSQDLAFSLHAEILRIVNRKSQNLSY